MNTASTSTSTDWNALDNASFRATLREFFETRFPGEWRYPQRRLRWSEIGPWYLALSKQGWVAPNWPSEYGGMGLSPEKLIIFIEEQERWGVAGRIVEQRQGLRHHAHHQLLQQQQIHSAVL